MKGMGLDLLHEAIHSYVDRNEAYYEEYSSEVEDENYDDIEDDSFNSYDDDSQTEEKVYVCNYDTIYICLYEELEQYRNSKQAKKKSASASWNSLLVITPCGGMTSMKQAPIIVPKEARKLIVDDILTKKFIDSINSESKDEKNIKLNFTPVNTNDKINATCNVTEVKSSKKALKKLSKEEMSKKKLKKQRQKEKKKGETQEKRNEPKEKEPEDDKTRTESKTESIDSIQDDVCEQDSREENEASADIDILSDMPAFVSNAVKKNEKKILNKKEEKLIKANKKTEQKLIEKMLEVKPTPVKEKTLGERQHSEVNVPAITASTSRQLPSIDPEFDFTLKKIKRLKNTENQYEIAVEYGKAAYSLIMNNKLSQAAQCLSEAILVNAYDLRHFLNRSFCYLRLGAYNLALKDAQIVIKYTNEMDELIKAKFRAGQALAALENFEEAEKYLYEAYSFNHANAFILRELMRVRTLQLLNMGFKEKDILEAFKEQSNIEDVIIALTEKTLLEEDDDYVDRSECDEDDIYNSDDEENPSFTRMLSNILKCQPGATKTVDASFPSHLKTQNAMQQSMFNNRKPMATEPKKIITTVPAKPIVTNKGNINDKAIWVGNTGLEVTDNMLRKQFTKYGKIISLYRKPNESYTFINFESAKDVAKLLSSTAVIEMDGHKLPIKAANKQK